MADPANLLCLDEPAEMGAGPNYFRFQTRLARGLSLDDASEGSLRELGEAADGTSLPIQVSITVHPPGTIFQRQYPADPEIAGFEVWASVVVIVKICSSDSSERVSVPLLM